MIFNICFMVSYVIAQITGRHVKSGRVDESAHSSYKISTCLPWESRETEIVHFQQMMRTITGSPTL